MADSLTFRIPAGAADADGVIRVVLTTDDLVPPDEPQAPPAESPITILATTRTDEQE